MTTCSAGWQTIGDRLVFGEHERCAGCGAILVFATSGISDVIPSVPAMKYDQGDCPVCDDWGDGVQLLVQR